MQEHFFIFNVHFQNLVHFVFTGALNSLQFRARRQCYFPSPELFQFFIYKIINNIIQGTY